MSKVIAYFHSSIAYSAVSIAETTRYCRLAIAITVGERACLSTEHLTILLSLSRKLAAHFIGPFPVFCATNPVSC